MKDSIERTSEDSLLASGPPSITPITGMGGPHLGRRVAKVGRQLIVHVEYGRGDEFRQHLASHGIAARVSPAAETPFERLEIDGDTECEVVQAILDEWED